ncbi:hypothetical protein Tco_1070596 [Tanacetum coccineum]|uniref:Uncharacterized protein n=1 Tax=Tanacetum coccineum TaxID=301880 RepID=A0ABQ5HMZ8_9ASTR
MQSSSVSSDFTDNLLNFENTSPADNVIASLMDTTVHHEESRSLTSSLFTIPVTVIPEITSAFTTTIPLPPPSFSPLPQQVTPTPTPTDSEVTTLFHALPDFSSVFRFNKRIATLATNNENPFNKLLSPILQNILPQVVSKFATPVIERNIIESLEAAILAKSSSQPKSTYEAAASLSEELYDALVKSYNTKKDLFETYGEVFTLKRSQDDKDKDQDPSTGSD